VCRGGRSIAAAIVKFTIVNPASPDLAMRSGQSNKGG
jgi:hypothetical protein